MTFDVEQWLEHYPPFVRAYHATTKIGTNWDRGAMWARNHVAAFTGAQDNERVVINLVCALAQYLEGYGLRDEHGDEQNLLAHDYVLGPAWSRIWVGARGLLNGECGRLDCGTIDGLLGELAYAAGYGERGHHVTDGSVRGWHEGSCPYEECAKAATQ